MTTDNTPELDELKRLYRCIMHDFHDSKDREDMWVREVGLVVNKQIEAVLDRLEARLTEEASGIRQIKTDYAYGFTAANDQTNEAIEAERNKLNNSYGDVK